MQRLFSTFPNSWPGLGLLILRVVLAASCLAIENQPSEVGPLVSFFHSAPIACGSLLLAGLWTPLVALILGLLLLWTGVAHRPFDALPFILTGIAISMAMLGPGAWSLDALRFGRKRIEVGSGRDR
jgi:putative oxidoreductase